jgi:hypothetical protein
MSARPIAVLAILLVYAPVAAAGASGDRPSNPVRLTVKAAPNCPGREAFLGRLEARGVRIREPQADERAPSMRVELRADDGQVFGQLTFHPIDGPLDGEDLRREVQGTDCDSVAASLALVAAVILDPTATDAAAVVQPVPAPCPVPAPIPTCTAPPRQEPAPAAPPRQEPLPPARSSGAARLSLGAALEAVAGLGPDATVVPRAFANLDLPAPLASASLRVSLGRGYTQTAHTATGNAEITLTDFRFEPCLNPWSPAAWRVPACGLVEGAVLSGTGTNTSHARSESRALLGLGLGLRPTWVVRDQITLGLLVGASVPLARYRFYFASPDTTAYRLAAWSALGEFSVGVRFW